MLDDWAEVVRLELGLPAADHDEGTVGLVLDTARDVAHGVARPAAPLTAYLLGLAVGRSPAGAGSAPDLAARISELAADWKASHNGSGNGAAAGGPDRDQAGSPDRGPAEESA
ncbi:MAG TPA: DUF6457 domain-containing protein [Mycobacteriales bacterium]|nr:DUF6457 domain-containing protein [Mycobacteriales bacterium]